MSRAERAGRRALNAIARFAGGGPRPYAEAAGVVVERGEGSYLYDTSGGRYLDTVSGFGVASLGHSHPHWVQAVVEQAGRLGVAPLDTAPLGRYLEALGSVLPSGLERVALFSGGAEAVEMAVRLGQTYSGRAGVLTFGGGFHGKTAALRYTRDSGSVEARSLGPRWLRTATFPECERHDAVDYPSCQDSADEAIAELAERDDAGEVGVVLVEPIQGTAGNIVPVRRFLPALRALCDERGWVLVLDEAITGFGRLGRLFGCEYFGVRPDAIVLSKGLGGGFPLSALCASTELWRGSALGRPSGTTTTFGGNPLACAAGLATLEIVTGEGFLKRVQDVSERAAHRLHELAAASPVVARPRGVGLMLGFDQVDSSSGELASSSTCHAVARACRDRGMLTVAHVPRVRISPPLTVSPAEIDEMFGIFAEVLA
jgi:4-aminobutyrate aminotransferase/(S)-3-amino-2-methylpropionate transaminase